MKYTNIEWNDIDYGDYPDFVDANISYAEYDDGTPLSDIELEELNNDGETLYDLLMSHLF